MGVPCMPVRTKCVVLGRELHGALGTQTPPGIPFTPSKMTLWLSASPTHYGMGDPPVPDVIICGEPAVNKGADTKYLRPHVVVVGVVPPTVLVGPIIDLGFIILVIAVGGTKPVWGPRSVQAGAKSIAVIAIPYSPFCPFNQMICSDPCDMPIGVALQMPSSVFVGMTLGDYALCILSIAADMVLSFLLNVLFGGLDFVGDFLGKMSKGLMSKLIKLFGKAFFKVLSKGVDWATERIVRLLIKKLGDKFSASAIRRLTEALIKPFTEAAKKYVGGQAGALSPDGPFGFGSGERTNPLSPKLPS